jgi:hypothetical protein
MKIIITENQYRLLRRQSEIDSQIKPIMDLTYEWLQNGQTYPLSRREYDAFISTVAMGLANKIVHQSYLDGDEKVTLRNQMLHYIKNVHGSEMKDYFFGRLDDIKKINENILDNNKPVEMLNKLKTDIENPSLVSLRDVRLKFMLEEMKKDPAVKIQLAGSYAGIANYWKFFDGETKQLIKFNTYGQKQQFEKDFSVWAKGKSEYENIFTDNNKLISPEYQKFLYKFKEEDDSMFNDEFYHRVWTRPVQTYAKNYTKFDVSLAPIKNHVFNRVKSQLKVIEAGFYKKALIASNLGPYTIDLKHSLQHGNFVDGNALLVDEGRNHSDWFKYVKKLIDNPNWAYDLGERLYETVKDTYDLNIVTKTRAEFYKSIV